MPPVGDEKNKKCSGMNYYSYQLMIRENEENHMLKCRQLFHQYVVNLKVKIETKQFMFFRLNLTEFRSEEYVHLRDVTVNDGNTTNIVRLMILECQIQTVLFMGMSLIKMQLRMISTMSAQKNSLHLDIFIKLRWIGMTFFLDKMYEIEQYQAGSYISSNEAEGRILPSTIHE